MTQAGPSERAIRSISDWLVGRALADTPIETVFGGFCERLATAGIPLRRAHLSLRALHPLFRTMAVTWLPDGELQVRRLPAGADSNAEWLGSPLRAMIVGRHLQVRHRLDRPGPWASFPFLCEWAERGATDYVAILTGFGDTDAAFDRLDGVVCSWLTDRPGGFRGRELGALRRLQPRFAVAVKVAKREQTAQALAAAYLGADAGRRVLDGQIRRGDGERIEAVLWYSDMRDSTSLAERLAPDAFLAMLDHYFECTAGPVLTHGGQVLAFIGDAVFGVFPLSAHGGAASAAAAAIAAAREAMERAAAANSERAQRDEPPIRFGLGLHIGDVLYGNIGVPERLEFSVIGRAANVVSRIEGLTKRLGRPLLASAALAESVGAEAGWQFCGRHALRGMADEIELFTLHVGGDDSN